MDSLKQHPYHDLPTGKEEASTRHCCYQKQSMGRWRYKEGDCVGFVTFGPFDVEGGPRKPRAHVDQGNGAANEPTVRGVVVNCQGKCSKEQSSEEDEFVVAVGDSLEGEQELRRSCVEHKKMSCTQDVSSSHALGSTPHGLPSGGNKIGLFVFFR